MKLKKKFIFFTCLLLLMSFISGCGVSQEKKSIYDDKEKIVQERDSFTYKLGLYTEDCQDKVDLIYKGFYGTNTIWNLEAAEDAQVTFEFDSKVDCGEFKAVLISPDKEIENILIGNKQGSKTFKLTKGKYFMKFVGRNAKGKTRIYINDKQNVIISRFSC